MNENIRKILERPFEAELLKQRRGPANRVFSYVEVQRYVDRLNEAFEAAWSWEVVRREIIDDQIIVEGRLTAVGVIKTGLGGASITRRRDDGSAISLADDFKKGEADAIKRACRLLGIGGHLYVDDDDVSDELAPASRNTTPNRPHAGAPMQAPQRHPHAPPMQRTPAMASQHERNRLTAKQLNAIWAIARTQRYSEAEFRNYCTQHFGAQPEFLTRTFASRLIESLGSHANGHDRQPGEEG